MHLILDKRGPRKVPSKVQPRDIEALFEKLFSSSPDAIVVVDERGRIVEANPQVESLFGFACDELLGSPIETLIPDRFRSVHPSYRSAYNDRPMMRPMGSGLELFGMRKDGSEFPADIMISPVKTEAGNLVLAVIRDITERMRMEEELRQVAWTDSLTGLGNHRRLADAFETEAKRFERTGRVAALLLIDLNGLKKINDTQGHVAGDRALQQLADALRAECRSVDTPTRYGGDEFVVILPETNAEGAVSLALRLTNRLANDRKNPHISFSHGVGVYPNDGQNLDQLLEIADRHLYEMKKQSAEIRQ
jgi:diguanylate cyclase (GGDEF)-like protein/PAS domain S-box-containing protein